VLDIAGNITDVGRSLTSVVLAATATAGSRVFASVEAHLLLGSGGATGVARLGEVGAWEVTLAAEGLRVLLLVLTVLTETTDRGRRESLSRGGVGVVHSGLVA
jgi:hypothetical protein